MVTTARAGRYEINVWKKHCRATCTRSASTRTPGKGSTRLGDYRSTEGATLTYDGGEYCWNGPARSLLVNLECGASNELVSVDEPRTCVYEAIVRTPAVCGSTQVGDECAPPPEETGGGFLRFLGLG